MIDKLIYSTDIHLINQSVAPETRQSFQLTDNQYLIFSMETHYLTTLPVPETDRKKMLTLKDIILSEVSEGGASLLSLGFRTLLGYSKLFHLWVQISVPNGFSRKDGGEGGGK